VFFEGGVAIPDSQNLNAHYVASEIDAMDGDAVTTWPDVSGNGFDATGGSPVYRESAVNGEAALEFDGTDDFFDTGYSVNTNSGRSRYVLWQVTDTDANDNHAYGAFDTSGDGNRTYLSYESGGGSTVVWGSPFVKQGSPTINSYVISSHIADDSTTTVEVWDNQTSLGTTDYEGQGDSNLNEYIGARNQGGSDERHLGGFMAEYLDYNAVHDSTTRNDVESYLNDKYSVL